MTKNRYLVLTAFVCGAVVMIIELIGSRVIGPPFGVSLFVWTSLITVTLVSLALGYWIGGRLADARENAGSLFLIILASGVYLLFVPVAKGFVMASALALGLRLGSLASSTALFGPPLFLLGMVTPYVVKLYMRVMPSSAESNGEGITRPSLGKTVGWLYAVSTAGSFIGTLGAGFILIPNLGVNMVIYLSSLTLIILTVGFFLIFRRKYAYLMLLAAPLVPVIARSKPPVVIRPDGTKVEIIRLEDSPYGQIKVVDYSFGDTRLRELLLDNMVHGAIDVKSGLAIYEYYYNHAMLAKRYNPSAKKALAIGLGAGIIPTDFRKYYGIETDVVEIDGAVVDAASRYFNFGKNAHKIHVEDGRFFLKNSATQYDVIVLDAFSGDTAPGHLMSAEAFALAKKTLAPGGVLIINFVAGNQPEDRPVPASLYRTLNTVFKNVDVYAHRGYTRPAPQVVNMSFVAYGHQAGIKDGEVLNTTAPIYPPLEKEVTTILNRKIHFDGGPLIFTDDYNPVDFYDARTHERFRENALKSGDMKLIVY
ncbi:MAG: fused MFS/spermidine synthase [Deltaproteobacteria bacterium]|nr:fused MFS/spermidine synthase [Deltaproteobacteria bacterium]